MADAWQWRAYLAMLPECVDFRYDCFVKGYHSKTRPPSVVPIKAYEPIRLNRYDGLERDVEQQLGAYVTYLLELARAGDIRLGVRGVLTEKQEANALDLDSPLGLPHRQVARGQQLPLRGRQREALDERGQDDRGDSDGDGLDREPTRRLPRRLARTGGASWCPRQPGCVVGQPMRSNAPTPAVAGGIPSDLPLAPSEGSDQM